MDFLIIKEKEKLLSKRAELVKIKNELVSKVKDLKISEGVAGKFNSGILQPHIIKSIGEEKFYLRSQLTKEIIRVEKEFTPINQRLSEIWSIEDKDNNSGKILKEILKEILSQEQLNIIFKEKDNRELGLPPTKVNIGIDNSVNNKQLAKEYRDIAQKSLDMLISVRKKITSVIDDGCNRFDKGYFLQCISPLNREIPPLSELDKLKRTNHLN